MEVFGYAPWGYEGHLVRVEIDLHRGIPGLEIVGLPGSAVKEARDRIRIALHRAGFVYPQDRILINLSPADLPKTGSGYDLPLALALLAASGQWTAGEVSLLAHGELSLDGSLRRVPGTLAAAARAHELGLRHIAVPEAAVAEARGVPGLELHAAATLTELLAFWEQSSTTGTTETHHELAPTEPFLLRGQPEVVKALQVGAAGGHSMLLYGPPGSGKTLAARTFESLLPPFDGDLSLETSRLWSLAGKSPDPQGLLVSRPFREPHHSASTEGILGGGPLLSPGEISLAHHGTLFLDEAPEFSPRLLQALREPLESGRIQVVRAGRSAWYPARFLLLMTANGCPCGQTGSHKGTCFCSAQQVRRYWDRIGNALMDRVDLRVFMTPADPQEVLQAPPLSWEEVRDPVLVARQRQRERGQGPSRPNSLLGLEELRDLSALKADSHDLLARWGHREDWSTRALGSVLRVALTLADLEASPVLLRHLEAACNLRKPSGGEPWRD